MCLVLGSQEQTDKVPQVMSEDEFRHVLVPVMRPVDVPVRSPAVQTVERTVDLPKIIYEVVKLVSQMQAQNRTVEQSVAAFVPQIQEEVVEVIRFTPQECDSDRSAEQNHRSTRPADSSQQASKSLACQFHSFARKLER